MDGIGEGHASPLWSRPFRGISAATAVSSLGDGAALVGFPLLAASLDHSPLIVALVMVAQRAPWLFSILTGALADRIRLRSYVAAVELSRMVIVGLLGAAVAGHFHPLAAIFLAAAALGTFDSAFFAATGRMVTATVDPGQLGRANGYLFAVQMGAEGVAGQALGGVLAAIALSLPFILDGASFALSALLLVTMVVGVDVTPPAGAPSSRGSIVEEMRVGLRWFLAHAGLRLASLYVAVLAFCQSMVLAVLVLWALRDLHLSRSGYGFLLGIATVGMVLAAVVAGRAVDRLGAGPILVVGGALAAFTYGLAGTTSSPAVAAVALFLEQAGVASGSVANQAMRQSLIPAHMIGRVANVSRSMIYGAMPIGALTGGVLASRFGLRVPFFVAGGLQLAFVAAAGGRLVRLFPSPGRTGAPELAPEP